MKKRNVTIFWQFAVKMDPTSTLLRIGESNDKRSGELPQFYLPNSL